jgi:hypothetical protein
MSAAAPDLDAWVPLDAVAVRTRHRREAASPAPSLWAAASSVRLSDTRSLGRVVRWRIPGTSPDITFRELFAAEPFRVLEAGERHSLSGLCGRIWTLQHDYAQLRSAEEFRAWREPGTARVLVAHWVEPAGDGRAVLHSETRVAPVDPAAALRTRAIWALLGVFERLIGAEALAAAVQRAGEAGRAA